MKRQFALSTTLMLMLGLSACHHDDKDTGQVNSNPTPNTKNVTVTPSLGLISNAAIKAVCSDTQISMGMADVAANGSANLTLTGGCSAPIVFELIAKAGSQYYDEALGTMVALPVGTSLRVAVPSLQALGSDLGVTALTEMAVQRALALGSNLTPANVITANQEIAQAFFDANSAVNLLSAPTVWSSSTTQLGSSLADEYAFYLAALAKLAKGDAAPALKALELLAADFKDGQIDQVEGVYANAEALRAAQKSAMLELAAFADTALKEKLQLNTDPVDPAVPNCGDQTTLSLADLASYVGSYEVKIIDSSAASDPTTGLPIPVKTTTLMLSANGQVTLDGQVASTVKVCGNSGNNKTGVMVHLDKSDFYGRSHVDFWSDGSVNGTDYTSAGVFRYFNGTKQGTTTVDPTPNTACDGNTNPYGCLTVNGLNSTTAFEHRYTLAPTIVKNPIVDAGTVTWANDGGGQILNSTILNLTYTYSNVGQNFRSLRFGLIRYGASSVEEQIYMDCGSSFAPSCEGLTVDMNAKTITLNNTTLTKFDPQTETLTTHKASFSGTLKF